MADSEMPVLSREISPPPDIVYMGSFISASDEIPDPNEIHKISITTSPPPPEMIILSPSVPESFTANTDDEANVSPEPFGGANRSIDYSPNNNNSAHCRSPSDSWSHEESKIEQFYNQQELAKKQKSYSRNKLDRPFNLPPKSPRDEDKDDEIMDKILINYQRQESGSRDKRRSFSTKHAFSLLKQRSPSHKARSKLPRIKDDYQVPPNKVPSARKVPSSLTKHGTRKRRAETHQALPTSPSESTSTFLVQRNCNEINGQVPLRTHIEKWQSITETEEPTPSPAPASPEPYSPTGLPKVDPDQYDQDGVPEDTDDLELMGIPHNKPLQLVATKSSPNPMKDSNKSISGLKVHTKTPSIPHLQSHSVNFDDDWLNNNNTATDSDAFWNNIHQDGSMTPQFYTTRRRGTTIRSNKHHHHPVISRGFSESEAYRGLGDGSNVDIEQDGNFESNSDDDDDDEKDDIVIAMEEEKIDIDQRQSALALQTTTQALMVSCGDSKEVFQSLWKICTSLKKDPTYQISFDDKLLTYDHVESFLKLLGFLKNKDSREWVCFAHTRVKISLIDTAILECHKCRQIIQQRGKTIDLVMRQRRISETAQDISDTSHNHPSRPPLLNLPTGPLDIVQQSKSYEESHIYSDEEDEKDEGDSVQLYELIWGITHNSNEDPVAKEVLLLCYPLVTTAKYILYCLEARFFNDDHDGRITISNVSSNESPSSIHPPQHMSFSSFDGSGTGLPSNMKTHIRRNSSVEFNKGVKYDNIKSSFSVQAKVIEFIRHWMGKYWDKDWDSNPKLVSYCKLFMRRIRKAYQSEANEYDDLEVTKGVRLVEMLDQTMKLQKSHKQMRLDKILGDQTPNHLSPRVKHKKSGSKSFFNRSITPKKLYGNKGPKDLMDVNFVIVAEQITLLQFNLFKKIHPRECLKQAWKNKDRKDIDAPNITQYIDAFNRLTKWIQSSILVASNVKSRGRIIKRWVKIEEELYKLRNFQAICAVYCALASTPIYRLKDAWSYVPKKHITQHEMIKVIMKSTGNWKNLRRLQLETHPPMIPYFGMFAQDLIVMEETTNNRSNDGTINWDALWKENTAIDKHLIYQNTPYNNLDSDASIQRWMNKELTMSGKLDDEWVYQVSDNVVLKDKRELGKDIKTNGKTSPNKKRTMSFFNKSK